jgi:glycosyltransferase involved in cell wall biosynthesis
VTVDLFLLRTRGTTALVSGVALCYLGIVAVVARAARELRRLVGRRPRIVWGNTPIINIKYWSRAVQAAGYRSRTIVTHVYPSNDPRDFDIVADQWLADRPRLLGLRDYLLFARVLWSADIVSAFFDGGFLRATPLSRAELRLLRLAGCKLVLIPFGSDVAVRGHLGPTEASFAVHYAYLLEQSEAIRARVDRLGAAADLVIKTLQVGYLPRHDAFWSHGLAIDTDRWSPREDDRGASATSIVHAPNHRQLKGTDAVIEAVDRLRAEGLDVRLVLLEGRPNEEVREAIRAADIAVDQLLTGYGLFAVECMSAGVPVISNLRWMPRAMREAPSLVVAPIVDADAHDLVDRLRELVTDPERRRRLGRESRSFAVRYHSYETIGRVWTAIFEHVWRDWPLPAELAPLRDESS